MINSRFRKMVYDRACRQGWDYIAQGTDADIQQMWVDCPNPRWMLWLILVIFDEGFGGLSEEAIEDLLDAVDSLSEDADNRTLKAIVLEAVPDIMAILPLDSDDETC